MTDDLRIGLDLVPGKPCSSPEYEEALRRWEALPSNRKGGDKTWMHRAAEDARRHFERTRRIR